MAYIYGTDYNDDGTWQWVEDEFGYLSEEYFPILEGTDYNDNIYGFDGNDYLYGYYGNDNLDGGDGDDYLYGGDGNDILRGWSGSDWMEGSWGNDTYYVESTGDRVYEYSNEGTDTVSSSRTYTLTSNVENLMLTGTANINGTGNTGNNIITGNSATNYLNGGAGNDTLDGKGGFDKLTGGTGYDIFKFTVRGPADLINDFNVPYDTIQLENAVFTRLSNGSLSASQFRVGSQALDSNDYVLYDRSTGELSYDADGSGGGAETLIADLNAGLNLTSADIFAI